jgi:hypothetical protein
MPTGPDVDLHTRDLMELERLRNEDQNRRNETQQSERVDC